MRLFIALFTAIPLVLMFLGLTTVARQHQAVASAVATPATIAGQPGYSIASRLERGKRTSKYQLQVDYRYTVSGTTYASAAVFPHVTPISFALPGDTKRPPQLPGMPSNLPDTDGPDVLTDKAEADRIVATFAPGKPATAWYDPANPARAFLVRRVEFTPYLLVLGPMIHFSIGLGLLVGGAAARNRPRAGRPIPAKNGWFELPVGRAMARRRRPWAVIALVWFAVGGPVAAHYAFLTAGGPWDTLALICVPAYFALGLVPVIAWVYYRRLTKNLRDARVWVDVESASVGRSFKARAEQVLTAPLPIKAFQLGLVCLATHRSTTGGKTSTTTGVCFEHWTEPESLDAAPTAHPLAVKGTFKVPYDQPPTTPNDQRGLPRHRWVMRVRAAIPNHPDYQAEFPIDVVK